MSAGLPGLGLGGLFFIFSALLAPFRELWRTIRGRSRPGEWRAVARQFAQAVTMVIAIDLTLRLIYVGLSLAGTGDVPSAASGTVLPLTLIGITTALVAMVVSGAKVAQLGFRLRKDGPPRLPDALPRSAPLRALAFGGAAAVAWVALLSVGASELSPLAMPPDAASSRAGERDRAGISSSDSAIRPQRDKVSLEIASVPAPDAGQAAPGPAETGPDAKSGTQPSSSTPPTTSISAPAPSAQVHGPPRPDIQTAVPEGAASQPQAAGVQTTSPGAPANAGPSESSPAPEHAGPPPEVPAAPERGEAPEESPAPEHTGAGR